MTSRLTDNDCRIVIIPRGYFSNHFSRRDIPHALRRERCEVLLMTGHQHSLPPTIDQLFTNDLPRWFLATTNSDAALSAIKPYRTSDWHWRGYGEVTMTFDDYIHLKLSI